MNEITMEKLHEIRAKTGEGLMQIKCRLQYENYIEMLNGAQNFDELKAALLYKESIK